MARKRRADGRGEPKLIRLYIRDAGWNPDRIPEEYREVLREELARDPFGLVKRHYRALSAGDIVTVSYLPARGVTMKVNGRQVVAESGHALIDPC
ncbi:MAG: hypothetical protein GEU92_13055 [Alphaproteobacteria bacterium]|nr:hypothetical protein [Alphaproteobacteria bacterium]